MENSREARRRKILERGSDRLAFIAGQVKSVPAPSSSSPPPPFPQKEEHPQAPVAPSSEADVSRSHLSDKYGSSNNSTGTSWGRLENERNNGISKTHAQDEVLVNKKEDYISTSESRNQAEEQIQQNEIDSTLLSTSSANSSSNIVVSTATSKKLVPFSSKQINDAISASENLRLLCAVTIALLVVASNHGFAVGGVFGSLTNLIPLLLLIMTDLTIVLWLLMTRQGSDDKKKERARTGGVESGWTGNMGDILETLLTFSKVASSVFMDCSICAVMIISGLSI
ncbi:hypothetical protein Cni_G05165 [Canna indica]|uniref:Uncharacterized protein n=1 Tax=Canna indica TaxID=4628 RepID=A0AAQ3Q3G9_9LILI|nr:hypothetical protein Cni_G05165 [Canna indica]